MILFLLFIALSIIIPISFFTIQSSQKIILETTFDLCKNLSENISDIAREELFIDSTYEASISVVDRLKESKLRGLTDVKLMNVKGQYVVRLNQENSNEASQTEIQYVKSLEKLDYIETIENQKNILRFISPVYLDKKKESFKIGAAIFDFDKDLLFLPLKEIQNRITALGGGILLASIIVTILFSYFFTDSIAILSKGVKIISDGNYDYKIKIKSRDEIGEFADSFNHMTHNIKMANKAKDEFLANLSHELKTPLSVVYAYAEMLQSTNNDPVDIIDYAKEIYASSQKLNEYVNDLIFITDIETNVKPDISSVDIQAIIQSAINQNKVLQEEKSISINFKDSNIEPINADASLVEKMILAILKNAIVYNQKNGQIRIETKKKIIEQSPFLEILISDSGIGIANEYKEKIFEKFFRIDSSLTYEVSGVGIGLFIAKKIIDLHSGKIEVRSELGKGTDVSIYLPY